eukprot:scaffold3657_cov80-Phaeocystis_antarctica.AAC.2
MHAKSQDVQAVAAAWTCCSARLSTCRCVPRRRALELGGRSSTSSSTQLSPRVPCGDVPRSNFEAGRSSSVVTTSSTEAWVRHSSALACAE